MSYFLPSFFQKRLLRYLLTRLDFLDSDEFDLDNLGLKWGQRTVIELKNVGIKTKRIADILQLPPSLALTHASIKILRLTIPADLHISGIEVEVDGVEAIVSVRPDLAAGAAAPTSRSKGGFAPNKTDRANLPRISSPSVDDPGGRHGRPLHLELSQVIPRSEDLAASFLEAESPGEIDELQAALESQSQMHMQESMVSSASSEDVGLGMPGGLSLPTFVANFLKGVADRLSVKVKDVNVVLEMDLSVPGAGSAENTKFMLSVGNIAVDALQKPGNDETQLGSRRSVTVGEVQLFVLSESETFSEFSGLSSPKLARSRPRLSHPASSRSDNSDRVRSSSASLSQHSDRSKLSSASLSNSEFGLGFEDAALSDSTIFRGPSRTLSAPHDSSDEFYQTDNRAFAESAQGSVLMANTHASRSLAPQSENLEESRTFTHDEAESMYMSAMSDMPNMPGGFGWTAPVVVPQSEPSRPEPDDTDKPPATLTEERVQDNQPVETSNPTDPKPASEPGVSSGESVLENHLASYFQSRILHVDSLKLQIPEPHHGNTSSNDQRPTSPPRPSHASQLRQSNLGGRSSPSTFLTDSRLLSARSVDQDRTVAPSSDKLGIDIGAISVDLDIIICRILLRSVQTASDAVPTTSQKSSAAGPAVKSVLPTVKAKGIAFNFCEAVPKKPPSKVGIQTIESMLSNQQALLKLSLSSISFAESSTPDSQRLAVSKIVMTHGPREVLSFVDSINVRDSIATSSMLRPHDIVVNMVGNRYEVQIKPVHAVLDLLVIDDVLSRSGGLSSLLDLGNSIMSTNTVKGPSTVAPPDSRLRTVRFSDPQRRPRADSDPASTTAKVDIRVSGVVLDLIGSESSVQVKSSAIKTAYRDSNVKLVIDGAAVEGPSLAGTRSRGDIYAKIRNIELHYSNSPDDDDLDRLLSLITPSSDKYDQDDDIMVDTLLRQRRKGGVLRLTVGDLQAGALGLRWTPHLIKVADEISKLSSVTKYLPEDDRPGILTFALVKKFDFRFDVDERFGPLRLQAELAEGAHINLPSLAAAQIAAWTLSRSDEDVLIGDVLSQSKTVMGPPMFMCRFIADEMEPTVRLKLSNTCIEYKVPTIVALTELAERMKTEEPAGKESATSPPSSPSLSHASGGDLHTMARKIRISLAFRDSAIALIPDQSPAKGLFVLTDAVIRHENLKRGSTDSLEIKKASLLIINDVSTIGLESGNVDHKLYFEENDQVQQLTKAGFVPVGSMSSASAIIHIVEDKVGSENHLDIEFRNNLLFLETCADSTQTMFQILGGLSPPSPPSKVAKYRTEVVPIQDMLASFTGNAFVSEPGPELGLQAPRHATSAGSAKEEADYYDEDEDEPDFVGLYGDADDADDEMTASHVESDLGRSTMSESIHIAPVDATGSDAGDSGDSVMMHSLLDFRADHFVPETSVGGTAHRWNSTHNTYGLASDTVFEHSPLKVRIRDVHVIWNLFDGYDWQSTRDTISQAVKEIENKALARRPRSSSRIPGAEEDDESVIGDFLFNSIYIGIPANKDPRDLASAINHDIDDLVSETGSYATGTTVTATMSRRTSGNVPRQKKLKLHRSKHHKMAFELEGVSADILAFPPGSSEVQSSVDVRIKKLEIFDHVPTSTWKKFATYMQDAGEREHGANMVHIELLNVKPVADLSASEMVLKVSILPLRLHVDQDALDFLTRFFEFKDESAPASSSSSSPPFIQRAEINAVQLRLDYKPKKVDYAALRSGRTTEFMNFIVLDRADMVLRRVILYGVSGFDRLGIMLNSIWSPDVKRNQLSGVLAGLAPVRPLVDVTSGVRDLIAVPIREYRKDGRIVRSIQKGALAFAKTTTTELVNLGAKMAIGTQQILQNTEELLVSREKQGETDENEEARKQISLYADQPIGIKQGLRTAYASLERDLLIARDAVVAVPGEVMASSSAKGAAAAILKQSPTIILRPAIGASKAVGQTLMGAGNMLDKQNLRRIDEKYKRH
ncbi:autophagy- protein 2 [Cladophialophora chaetospira]|uniref:Autophagy-related protein 2 n=1 Tax=Cladophialophora chaetospira TaxID=386627 RepID=A0AA38XNU4_9EURO|nr:autophagy- protein 2 [Cladophialophora chaetospira]